MAQSEWVRWGGLAGMGGGVLFIVYSLLGVAIGKGDEAGPLDLLAILAYVLIVVGLVGFHALQQRNYGRIGRAGLYTTIGAIVLWEILLLGGLLGGGEGLEWLVAVGVLGTLVGEVLYGAATLQARVLPRWCGVLFILLVPVRNLAIQALHICVVSLAESVRIMELVYPIPMRFTDSGKPLWARFSATGGTDMCKGSMAKFVGAEGKD